MARRTARTWARLTVGATALALLGAGSPIGGATSVAGTALAGCEPDGSSLSAARAKPGSHGEDPNSVTASQAAALDRLLQRRVDRLTRQGRLTNSARLVGRRPYEVTTHVHVITRDDGTGGVTEQQIADQIRVLNQAFAGGRVAGGWSAGTPFRFAVQSVDYTANDAWFDWHLDEDFVDEDAEAKAAKEALHVGTLDDLNIYIAGLGDGLLGYANYPGDGTPLVYDGLVLLNESLPGGAAEPYNLGDTATHEVGHWLGLFHTFENACVAPGDYVADTPYQYDGENIFECIESDNTCRQPGRDPVHNFMSYGDDQCLDRFTVGQSLRMRQSWAAFRYRR